MSGGIVPETVQFDNGQCPWTLDFSRARSKTPPSVSADVNIYALVCGIGFCLLKLMVRWVWYRPEERRPGFIRHFFIIRSLDFLAVMFLTATVFFIVNLQGWLRALIVAGGMIAFDLLLRAFFLHLEARRLCKRSRHHNMSMRHARHRLRRRARQESPF